ncbi:MAG: 30S ribosomal protein S12 methylthiotransferase RimO [Firmicutes bacterium]|nr:30S ribosomal protein S12 methylthiotransferase RimO [Bacillota bacterium]
MGEKAKVGLVSLGCNKNLVDSEIMLGLIEGAGYTLVSNPEEAEAIIVNTCGFIESAKREAIETIIAMGQYKDMGRCRSLLVTGCLVQRYANELLRELPEIDGLLGTGDFPNIVPALEETLAGKRCSFTGPPKAIFPGRWPRFLSTIGPSTYLKIAEGCSNCCSYCVIPQLRGPLTSRPLEEIVQEAEALAALGNKELVLVAQDTTRYGEDLYGKQALPDLLQRLAALDGVSWLRLLYCYPSRISPELIQVMKEEPKVLKYLDMPLQHVSKNILEKMGRDHSKEGIWALINNLREEIPAITIRTTFIVGFPGESTKDFSELLDFIAEVRFDRAGFFTYSREEGTPAATLPGQLSPKEKKTRYAEAMKLQQAISREKNWEWLGREMDVLVEKETPEPGYLVGRSYRDAPEIDGLVYVQAPETTLGNIIKVRITGASEYDLKGSCLG